MWRPGGGSDNKLAPELPLSKAIEALIAGVPVAGDCLFKVPTYQRHGNKAVVLTPDKPLNALSEIKARLDAEIAKLRAARGVQEAMPPWQLHDLRRTVKTRLAELGVQKEIRDLVMGHTRQGMDAVYDHSARRRKSARRSIGGRGHLQASSRVTRRVQSPHDLRPAPPPDPAMQANDDGAGCGVQECAGTHWGRIGGLWTPHVYHIPISKRRYWTKGLRGGCGRRRHARGFPFAGQNEQTTGPKWPRDAVARTTSLAWHSSGNCRYDRSCVEN